jgi:hypothetical protein
VNRSAVEIEAMLSAVGFEVSKRLSLAPGFEWPWSDGEPAAARRAIGRRPSAIMRA